MDEISNTTVEEPGPDANEKRFTTLMLFFTQYHREVTDMTRIDDFLDPLHQGVWAVTVPKVMVSEPLDAGWERSLINVPSPGTLASYRKGNFHVHETSNEWKVHLDRYDPKVHPFLHLADDAPLLLMIADTFLTLIISTRCSPERNTWGTLKEQRRTWEIMILAGFALALAGVWIITNPLITFGGIIQFLFPLGIMVSGVFITRKGISLHHMSLVSFGSLFFGISVFCLGIVTLFLPLDLFILLLLLILASWAFGSAYMSFSRVVRGKKAVPEGFYYRLGTGILSFLLAISILLVPDAILALLMEIFGVLIFLLGIVLCSGGWRLREKMKSVEA